MRSRYVEFTRAGVVAVLEEDVGEPAHDEVRVRATLSMVSPGTELTCLRGEFDPGTNWAEWVRYPFRPGYSLVGVVDAVGAGVTRVAPGDRVSTYASHQAVAVVPAREVWRIPDEISDEQAVWAPIAVIAAAGTVRAGLTMGETVGVVGLGPVGQLVVQYVSLHGASRVVAVDSERSRLDLAVAHGATDLVQATADDARIAVGELTGDRLLDVVFDVTGNPAVLASAVQLVRPLGRVVLLGDTSRPSAQALGPGVVSNSLTILGAHGDLVALDPLPGMPSRDDVTRLFFRRLATGTFTVARLPVARMSPLQAPDHYRHLAEGKAPPATVCFDWTSVPA